MRLFSFLCRKKEHLYEFKRAWEASAFKYNDKNETKSIMLAINDEEITSEKELSNLIEEDLKLDISKRRRFIINLVCKRCGHRITIEDSLYFADYIV
jgi:hypothetical protein